jgi:hypothetical protein
MALPHDGEDSMGYFKHLGSIAALTIITSFSANMPSRASTIIGTFQGFTDIEIQTFVDGAPVSYVTYSQVPSTINFFLSNDSLNPDNNNVQFSISNAVYSFNTDTVPQVPRDGYNLPVITDGIPGQSADSAYGNIHAFLYHAFMLDAGFALVDPSGEFIGPNGDGDPSNVKINASYVYSNGGNGGNGQIVTASFQTASIPEPSSIVLAASGATVILALAFQRARCARHP